METRVMSLLNSWKSFLDGTKRKNSIKTESDYEAALERISELMDAKSGTKEADELDVLATLIECYEDKHYPM